MVPPQASDRLVSLEATVYVVEAAKLLYVQVPKAACTTMLWTLLDLAGLDRSSLPTSRGAFPTPSSVIHDGGIHPVPTIGKLGRELREEALTAPEWMRLAVVRDPYARLYSAWESKILMRGPGPWLHYPQPDLVEKADAIDVGASFRAFVRAMQHDRGTWQADPHFAQQVYVMALDEIDYTDIVPTAALGQLFSKLSDRVGRPIQPDRYNEGLGINYAEIYDDESAEAASDLFAADLDRLDFERRSFAEPAEVLLGGAARRLLDHVVARNERAAQIAQAIKP